MSEDGKKLPDQVSDRVAHYRARSAKQGMQRMEIQVLKDDVSLLKAVAKVLRAGGDDAEQARRLLKTIAAPDTAHTGEDLVAFFQASPFREYENQLDELFARDPTTGREIDFDP